PRQRSRSARPSSGRVIVAYACTSCSRRPGRSSSGTRTQHTSSALPISKAATRAMICSSSCVCVSISPASPWTEPKAAAARGSQRAWLEKLILVLVATLKGPRLAPSTRLVNDLEDPRLNGVSRNQPHPIFRPERASPQGIPRLIRKRSLVQVQVAPPAISPGQWTWALLCRHRYALCVPHPCQMGADWRPVRAPLTRLACRLCPRAHAVVRWWREGRSTLRGGCCGPCAPSIPAGSHRLGR